MGYEDIFAKMTERDGVEQRVSLTHISKAC